MADKKGKADATQTAQGADQQRGQQKVHLAYRTNPDNGNTETKQFTQAEWRQRDKAEGWTRDDHDDEDDVDETSAPHTEG